MGLKETISPHGGPMQAPAINHKSLPTPPFESESEFDYGNNKNTFFFLTDQKHTQFDWTYYSR